MKGLYVKGAGVLLSLFLIINGACTVFHPKRHIEITFTIHKPGDFVPSRQTVVWLEKPDSSFVKSLYVSEYIAYGGYLVPGICPEWSNKADWQDISQEDFDAVTGATPGTGKVKFRFEYSDSDIPRGNYLLLMEIHLKEDYNIYCHTGIVMDGKKHKTNMEVNYLPTKFTKLKGKYISDIEVIYK